MDPFNPFNPSNPNNPPNPNNPFSGPAYYPQMEPNPYTQFSFNTFAGWQHSPNALSNPQQMQAVQSMMMRNPFKRARASNERTVQKEWKILTADVNTYPEEKRVALKKLQEKIMRKYE